MTWNLLFKIYYFMAKQREAKLVGTIGNVIFYNWEGEYCMRVKPGNVRRTEASVNSGLNFGKASRISRQVRTLIDEINPSKSNIQAYRFNGAINKFISWKEKKDAAFIAMPKKLPFIYGFQFNEQADLSSITAVQPSIKSSDPGLTEISLLPFTPSRSLQAPAHTKSIFLKMMLIGISLEKAETDLLGKAVLEIPYSNETYQPPVISIPASPKPGDLLIMVMAVKYMVSKNGEIELLNDKKKLPCGVVWAGYA
jgi:hypothetical protein